MPPKRRASRPKAAAAGGAARAARKRKADDGRPERKELEDEPDDPVDLAPTDSEGEDEGEVVDCGGSDDDMMDEDNVPDEDDDEDEAQEAVAFRPGIDEVPEGEELEHDPTAYGMFHKLRMQWPSLSFCVVRDPHGASRTKFPMFCYWVCGSQSDDVESNYLSLMRASKMSRTQRNEDSEDEEDDQEEEGDDEDSEEEAVLEEKRRPHTGCVNRVRSMPQRPTVVAAWGEEGCVSVFDFSDQFRQLDDPRGWVRDNAAQRGALAGKHAPLLFRSTREQGHQTEGFALDWSPLKESCLASGDLDGHIWTWEGQGGAVRGTQLTAARPAPGSVEDLRWSPTQNGVFITANGGGTCQVYDARDPSGAKITWTAAADGVDINVTDWNAHRPASHLVATGADDGALRIWDLRTVRRDGAQPVQSYLFHRKAITSLEWSPINESMVAVACDDNQVTLWDFSIERDAEEEAAINARHPELASYPAQLVFQHCGLDAPKEVHWHPQLPGVVMVVDANGMDVFRPANWKSIVR
eukprot:TRINITY_DN320_c8_g1_i1.p1 TRINITY_DN320_c8_g1~~TRINITY_DN320_c8_g1_i1.p1  ORF type:complete len:552 (+),score=159.34 TRINITY_DN320_c8_g1_i1:86-1657(+)